MHLRKVKTLLFFVLFSLLNNLSFADSRVAIVGGGISGLSAQYFLAKKGIQADLFEASGHLGGRTYTQEFRTQDDDVFWFDQGGAFIDSDHEHLLELIEEFNIPLTRVKPENFSHSHGVMYFDKKFWDKKRIFLYFKDSLAKIQRIKDQIEQEPATENGLTETENRLNQQSVEDFLSEIGCKPDLYKILSTLYSTEFGTDLDEINALVLVEVFRIDWNAQRAIADGNLGDEARIATRGMSHLIKSLAENILEKGSKIHLNQIIVGIKEIAGDKFELEVENYQKTRKKMQYEHVIVTAPLPILKKKITMQLNGFPKEWEHLFAQAKMGHNFKFHLNFKTPFWRENIRPFIDISTNSFWIYDSSQRGHYNLTFYLGGRLAKASKNMKLEDLTEFALRELQEIYPEARQEYNKSFPGVVWPKQEHINGSYFSGFGPKNYQLYKDLEAYHYKNLYMAGEFWSQDFGGFINGAIETAKRAANDISKQL